MRQSNEAREAGEARRKSAGRCDENFTQLHGRRAGCEQTNVVAYISNAGAEIAW